MTKDFHKPTMYPGERFESFQGEEDPAELSRIAHESARALLSRIREDPNPELVARLRKFMENYDSDAIAQLWARSNAHSLPGALWRIYLLQVLIRQDPRNARFFFVRGTESAVTIDPIVAGAPENATPEEVVTFADQVLQGVFAGDFADSLERAAAFCRLSAEGAIQIANDMETTRPEHAADLTVRALRFTQIANDLVACSRLWRQDGLD